MEREQAVEEENGKVEQMTRRRAQCLMHVDFEGPGVIEDLLAANAWQLGRTRLYAGDELPDPEEIDLLVLMGGPMSVNDEARYPWLAEEKRFIRRMIELGRPVLGVCLGAQLIAGALGARVYPNRDKEIGWLPVRGVDHGQPGVFRFPREILAFHWHGETFDLPAGAVHLAESAGCRNQAFQVGSSVIGLQFHLEINPQAVAALLDNCRDELDDSRYVQSVPQILGVDADRDAVLHRLLGDILDFLRQNG